MKNTLMIALLFVSLILTNAQEALTLEDKAPNFRAVTTKGDVIDLSEITRQQQIVLFFYRGQWCPYCNKQMSELQDSLDFITNLGARVIAITPEKPEEVEKTIEKTGASFDIIYDENHKIMDKYKVTFKLPKTKHAKYKAWGIDINKASGNSDYALPVPATYIIDKNGIIKGSFFDEDYKKRMSVKEVVEILKR
ncbi:peroxiredoxin-like family protein [Saccharicrinis sp. GN24d3]|uniref:peroxiredoxin-like family protein n=1 Tax=Saccharicrinis sp. GN24d3 TaxID=3458416 RepID=UPI004036B2FB